MKDNKLKELAKEFCKQHSYTNEDDLYNFLVDNEWKIAHNYDNSCHREDISYELEDLGYDVNAIPKDLIDNILYSFEDKLGDYGSECGWRIILSNTIEMYEEDLEEYKLEEE